MTMVFEVDSAFAALRLLLDGRDRGLFSDAEFFKGVAEEPPFLTVKVEERTAGGAPCLVLSYEPGDALRAFLAAIAARDGNVDDEGKFAADHVARLSEIADPELREALAAWRMGDHRLRQSVEGCVLEPGDCRCFRQRYSFVHGICAISPGLAPCFVEALCQLGDHCPGKQAL